MPFALVIILLRSDYGTSTNRLAFTFKLKMVLISDFPWCNNMELIARLELLIHDYLIRTNLHRTAEIFAREVNINPQGLGDVIPNAPLGGFLLEWWSIFFGWWSFYRELNGILNPPDATEGSSQNVGKVPQSPPSPQNPPIFGVLNDEILKPPEPTEGSSSQATQSAVNVPQTPTPTPPPQDPPIVEMPQGSTTSSEGPQGTESVTEVYAATDEQQRNR